MVRCTHVSFIIVLIIWRKQGILGSDVTLDVDGTTCVGNNITLGCTINPFTTSATWSRNGSTALTSCTSSSFCSQDDLPINNAMYYFSGNATGIYVSFQIQLSEDDIEWICNHNATLYRYTFDVSETCTTNSNKKNYDPLYSLLLLLLSPLLKFLPKKKKRHCQYIYVRKTFGIKWSADVCRPGNEKWVKDGKTCQPIYLNNEKMLIVNATVSDEGLYVCSFGLNKMTMHYRIVVVENVHYVQEHHNISLGADMQGEQKWTKGTSEIAGNGLITNASKKDEGLYVCKHGWEVSPLKFYLIVYGGKKTDERIYVENSCDIEFGKSVVTDVTWNGPKNKEKKSLGNNMLVCGASLGDKGIYTCKFEKKEEILAIYNLTVVEIVYYIEEGGDITLGKNISGSQQWTKNKTVFKESETGLLISNASAKDEGLYVCKTENLTEIYLIVFGTEETLYVQTGSDIDFGKSIVTNVTWEKNGKQIEWRNSLGNMLIRDVSIEDEGLYVCSFKSSKLQSKYNLIVVGTEETLYVEIGSNMKFGKSLKTDVSWTKDGEEVEGMASSGNDMLIANANTKDEGLYVCTIKSNGMQLKYILVIVGVIVEINIQAGEDTTLGKPITKEVNSTVEWTKDGLPYLPDDKNVGTEISICMATVDHKGTYVCKFGPKNTELIYVLTVEPRHTENKSEKFSIDIPTQ